MTTSASVAVTTSWRSCGSGLVVSTSIGSGGDRTEESLITLLLRMRPWGGNGCRRAPRRADLGRPGIGIRPRVGWRKNIVSPFESAVREVESVSPWVAWYQSPDRLQRL